MIKVSVCIPSYNGGKFIAQTIQSVLDSTFQDFEIIVNDDASADDTAFRMLLGVAMATI